MGLSILLTGGTGMIGGAALIECLDHEDVDQLVSISRRSTGVSHPKLKEIITADVTILDPYRELLVNCDACFFCLGVSAGGMSKEKYYSLTYDLTLNFARQLLAINPSAVFLYVSGAGTDSSESGGSRWARVKGKTENDLLSLGFDHAFMFRPGGIIPRKGVTSSTRAYRIGIAIMSPFFFVLKRLPKYVTTSDQLALAMIRVVRDKPAKKIFESIDINAL